MSVNGSQRGIAEAELRKYVGEKLPHYMTPASIFIIEELPLTRNGKVDHRALPIPEEVRKKAEAEETQPRNAYEEIIGGIWKEVLKVERVRKGDNFFEIGGHSLSATQVISRVRNSFGVELGVRSIFEESTIEGLARRIGEAMGAGEKEQAPLVRVSRERRLPLSFAQQRLWFLDQLSPNNPFYNCPGAVRLEGRLDLEILESVINEIVRRHEVLRTRIDVDEGEPFQVIDAWERRSLELEDLTSFTPEKGEERVRQIAREEANTGFDLGRGPLMRVKMLKLGEERHVALFTMHHIVSDGWSMGVLVREVSAHYKAMCEGKDSPLSEPEIQYADYAVWQREWLKGEVLERQLNYWRNQLGEMPTLELPTDRPRALTQSYRGANETSRINGETAERLKRLSRKQGCTLFMTLLGAFQILLSRYSGQQDIVVGTDIANRNRKETEDLIGFFVNQLVLRTDLSGEPSFLELMKRVRDVALKAYTHQDVPFEKLVEELQPRRDMSRSPLFQVKLVLQNAPTAGELELPGLCLRPVGGDTVMARFDLTMFVTETNDSIAVMVNYNTDVFEDVSVKRMVEQFEALLESIVETPEQQVNRLSLMNEARRRQIVVDWNSVTDCGQSRPLMEIIAEQVKRRRMR